MRTPADAPPGRFVGGVRERAERATREASPWIEGLGRLGYIAKGIVYFVIGALAV